MKTLLFNFGAMAAANDKSIREINRLFDKAGAQVVSHDVAKTLTKRVGVAFRNVDFTFADGQKVTMSVKETGDVFEVRINGKAVPLRQQDDHAATVKEIAALLDKRRPAFQRALAKIKTPLPPSLRVSKSSLVDQKLAKRDSLKEAIAIKEEELADLLADPA